MHTDLIHVGFNNFISINRIIAIIPPGSAPTKRLIKEAKEKGSLIDMTNGRRTKAVLVLDNGIIVLAALNPETISGRLTVTRDIGSKEDSLEENE
ncbi:MAG: DUF370 domain-containing protein [Chloroflexi bacterium]|nr:DUF370 domain-containing protein [Chloroflexota bacterium]